MGAAAGYYHQAGATAYLIDPAGTYCPGGASAPTTDPAGAYSGAGARAPTLAAAGGSIPITGATLAAVEIVDPADAYALASVSAQRPTLPAQTLARARVPRRSPRRALLFRSPGRPPPRRRSALGNHTVARARGPPRSPPRAVLFRSQTRPWLRWRLSTLRAPTLWRA
jgi:hypothetical protein